MHRLEEQFLDVRLWMGSSDDRCGRAGEHILPVHTVRSGLPSGVHLGLRGDLHRSP